ncbi:YsnF/AvaK domain-containing protein [Geomonas sp. RF6]|uniref:YsnF/AvaK domain-containing protein n=1 Tax=Geomonas sp. RF6 TaxID=2897342 RepID=UPI001E607476|nr:DUF2382 domain-containing protein [Geomonas sp. RF6]UFS69017.1 YsnF/AvaK domain-containing protein [Geomonas sp. RF6]
MDKKSFLWGDSRREKSPSGRVEDEKVIPVVEEELRVGKRVVEDGVTRVKKVVHEREETVDMPLLKEQVHVERVPINAVIDAPVGIRQEGDVTVVPLIEEVLVVEKKLLLKEELHITKEQTTVRQPQTEVLKSEQAIVEHVDEPRKK